MRLLASLLVALLLPLAPIQGLDLYLVGPGISSCDDIGVDPDQPRLLDMGCDTGEVRPGARASGCTMNFVMTDGTDLYVGTAGHCGGVGKRWSTSGVGAWGTTVFRELYGDLTNLHDWALIKVDADKHGAINPSMYRFGGPFTPVPGVDSRPPIPGDGVVHYGSGQGFGQEPTTRGRAGIVAAPLGTTAFVFPGTVGPGDSGSPVRFATGETAGIAVIGGVIQVGDNRGYVNDRCDETDETLTIGDSCLVWDTLCAELDGACEAFWRPGGIYGIVIATRFDAALAAFEAFLGTNLEVLDGELPGLTIEGVI